MWLLWPVPSAQCPVAFQELRRYGRLSGNVAKNSPQLLSWLCAPHCITRKLVGGRNAFLSAGHGESPKRRHQSRLEEKLRAQASILQPHTAWSPFKPQKHGGQLVRRKQGQPIHRKSHSGGTGEEANRQLRRLQSGLRHWVSKEKVLEPEGGT